LTPFCLSIGGVLISMHVETRALGFDESKAASSCSTPNYSCSYRRNIEIK
jgi:hypothetical protein